MKQIKAAVAGVTGYAGAELARLLLAHPHVDPIFLGRMDAAETILLRDLHPQLAHNDGPNAVEVVPFSWQLLKKQDIDVLFLATPHEQSREWAPVGVAQGLRVIDLSGAWRLHEAANASVYQLEDADPASAADLQKEAIYGSPELHLEAIKIARLVANPGCYATSVILALAPFAGLIDLSRGIVADCKSGVSGAGKAATMKTHFMYAADNLSAYNVHGHRHRGELLEQLHLGTDDIRFTPHLLPIPRGILSTIYLRLHEATTSQAIEGSLRSFYRNAPMVRVRNAGDLPQIQHVVRTSYCDIGFDLAPNGLDLLLISCLDNLLKGAASQAVQNMNVMFGLEEAEGLR